MKWNAHFFTGIAAASLLTAPSYAADDYNNNNNNDTSTSSRSSKTNRMDLRYAMPRNETFANPVKVSDVIGKEVRSLQNEKLGKVVDVALDLQSGRIAQVIVSARSNFGAGKNGRSWAIPSTAFNYDAAMKNLRLDITTEKLNSAPTFELSQWDDGTNKLVEVYRYFGQHPYFTDPSMARDGEWTRNNTNRANTTTMTKPAAFGPLEPARKVLGRAVLNEQNDKLGSVDNIIVDLPMARIVNVVVASGGFLGIGDALSAIPPTAFHLSPNRDSLVLNVTKDDLARAPHFKSTEWPNFKDPGYVGQVYHSYGVEPYFTKDADNTARNVRDRQGNRLTPIDQGTSDSDVNLTRQIRKEIMANQSLSVNGHNVKIITSNGRVLLRGPVNSEQERQDIGEIANRIAQRENVDNQLEVTRQQ